MKVVNAFTGDEMKCSLQARRRIEAAHPDHTLLVPVDGAWDLPKGTTFAELAGARLARLHEEG